MYIRPIKPSDADGIQHLFELLSPESVYLRFFTPLPRLSEAMLSRFVNVDYVDRMALVAVLGEDIIAVARYDRIPGSASAEVAFLVVDSHQGRGLATTMLEYLAAVAKDAGISRFVADTLPENSKMLRVFHDAGFKDKRAFQDGVVKVSFNIAPTHSSQEAMHRRERLAVSRSVARILAPRTVAVVGASRVLGSVGNLILRNILDSNFQGTVYPINPNAEAVGGVKAYPDIRSLPENIDLAVLAVGAEHVPEVIKDAAEKHAGGVVIISAGFSDMSLEGANLESEVVTIARRHGMRVVGPASMGLANLSPAVSLNATLSPLAPLAGSAALHAQSGPLSLAILEEARRRGLGISSFVSSGNKADISGNDLLHYWEEDPQTTVIMLYIEDFGNPRTFARVARRVSASKPIIAVKAKNYRGGQRNSTSGSTDLGALTNDMAVEALFERTGVIRVDTLEQLFEQAHAMVSQPLPAGPRVGILSNTGGPAPLCVDACQAVGLEIPQLSPTLQDSLREVLPPDARVANPVELSPAASPADFGTALSKLLLSPEIDAAIVLYIPTVVGTAESPSTLERPSGGGGKLRGTPEITVDFAAEIAHAIARAAIQNDSHHPKPVLANFLSLPGVSPALAQPTRSVPSFAFPESAAIALGRMLDYQRWSSKEVGTPIPYKSNNPEAVEHLISQELRDGFGPSGSEVGQSKKASSKFVATLLSHYGLSLLPENDISSLLLSTPAARLRLSVFHDLVFGPFISLGLSGEIADLVGRQSITALPQSDLEAWEIVERMPGAKILTGYRSLPPLNRESLADVVMRVSKMSEDIFEIARIDIDPLVVTAEGTFLGATSINLANWDPAPSLITRALRPGIGAAHRETSVVAPLT